MLDEARKREKLANMALLASLGLTAAQSQKDFLRTGHIEGPGSALMQRFGQKRREAERNLDHGAISQAARNIKDSGARNKTVKQQKKSLKEFMHLSEMRKEDKVKGKGRTPLYKTTTKKRIEPDETGHLKVRRINRTVLDSPADMGRFKQGMKDPTALGPGIDSGGGRHPHGGGGSGAKKPGILRGKKRVPGEKKPRNKMVDGPSPAEKVANRRASKKAQDRMNRGRRAFEGFSNWRDNYSPLEVESFDLITNKPLEASQGIGSDMLEGYGKKIKKKQQSPVKKADLNPAEYVKDARLMPGSGIKKKLKEESLDEKFQKLTPEKQERVEKRLGELSKKVQKGYARVNKLERKPLSAIRPKVQKSIKANNEKILKDRNLGNNAASALSKTYNAEEFLGEKCWPGYEKKGMKTMFGKRYPNCVKKKTRKEEVELDEVNRSELYLSKNEDDKFKALLDKAKQSKKKPDSNYRKEGGPVRTSYFERKKKFFNKEELELEEAKEAKSCPAGKYWCYDSKKCKTIPTGWYVGRGGYLEKEEETKKKNGNGNGNGDHDSNGGSDGGGSNGGGGGE
tara:strand:+ start:2819 stop:4522 length:1704 start_codon:yes stop_codon:yes gene_type:complete